ncbi:MAG: STAS domain-containing protein [Acidobacteria bacterium]|nr:STAS domain-containing protein [Acidobacteriota bacterium]
MTEATLCPSASPASATTSLLPKVNAFNDTRLKLEVRQVGPALVLHCSGRITFREEAMTLTAKVTELFSQRRPIVLELSQVETVDSAGLGELILILLAAQKAGSSLRLAAPNRHVRQVLQLTRLTSVFTVYPALEEALLASPQQSA